MSGVSFTLFGFPVRVQASFFLVVILLGLFPGATVATLLAHLYRLDEECGAERESSEG